MPTSLMPQGRQRYHNNDGTVAAGCKLYTYAAGTVANKATWADAAGTTLNPNPITLDPKGEAVIFWDGAYKVDLKTAAGAQVTGYPVDNINTDPSGIVAYLAGLATSAGASLLGFLQSGVGAVLRTMQSKGRDVKNMADFGVVGDGATNDTINWQKGIDAMAAAGGGTIYANRGTYLLNKWYMKSNVVLILCPGTTLQCVANSLGLNERFINIDGVTSFGIEGNGAKARMNKEYAAGEQRHVLFLVDAHDGFIRNLKCNDSGGDGIYIGRNAPGTHCTNILIENCSPDNNRRQGLSWVSGTGINIIGGTYSGTVGANPQYGIDVEPNDSDDEISGTITGVTTKNNTGGGLVIALTNFGISAKKSINLTIRNITSIDDGNVTPNTASAGLNIAGASGVTWQNNVNGNISIDGVLIIRPKGAGLRVTNWDSTKAPTPKIRNVTVIDAGSGAPASNEEKSGLAIIGYSIAGRNFGTVDIENMKVFDTRAVTTTYSAVYVANITGGTGVGIVQGMRLKDVIGVGFVPTSGRGHVSNNSVDFDQSSITYTDEQIVGFIATIDPTITKSYAGYTITETGGGVVELPKASVNRGLSWRFRNADASAVQVRPNQTSPDLIQEALFAGRNLVLSALGAEFACRLTDGNLVATTYCNDLAKRPQNYLSLGREICLAGAPPAADTWQVKDRCWNATPTVGQPKSWVCTVSGTPGTWVSEGNL